MCMCSHHVSEPGDCKPLCNKSTKATTPEASTEEIQNVNSEESKKVAVVYSCPQDGCVRIFQRCKSTCPSRNAHGHLRDIL